MLLTLLEDIEHASSNMYKDIHTYVTSDLSHKCPDIQSMEFGFIDYVNVTTTDQYSADCYLHVNLPMHELVQFVPISQARSLARMHGVETGSRTSMAQLVLLFNDHKTCSVCTTYVTIVSVQLPHNERKKIKKQFSLSGKTGEEKHLIQKQTQQ